MGKVIERVGWGLALPGLILAWPGLQITYCGQDIALDALQDKPLEPVIHDPNFVKATRIE